MKIRVIKCTRDTYWYKNYTDQTFEVISESTNDKYPDYWEVWRDKNREAKGYVVKSDVEVVDDRLMTDTDKMVDLLEWLWGQGMFSVAKMDARAIVKLYNKCRIEHDIIKEKHVVSNSKG